MNLEFTTPLEALFFLLNSYILAGGARYGYYAGLDMMRQPSWVLRPQKYDIAKQIIFWIVYYIFSVIFSILLLIKSRTRRIAFDVLKDHFFVLWVISISLMVVSAAWSLSANLFDSSFIRIIFFYAFLVIGYWLIERASRL